MAIKLRCQCERTTYPFEHLTGKTPMVLVSMESAVVIAKVTEACFVVTVVVVDVR